MLVLSRPTIVAGAGMSNGSLPVRASPNRAALEDRLAHGLAAAAWADIRSCSSELIIHHAVKSH